MVEKDDIPALATAAPSPNEKRDLLGNFCFYLHFAVMLFVVAGWLVPFAPVLMFYLGFLPVMVFTWMLNKNSCVLNNAESWLRYRTWRSERNAEEGAWLMTLIKNLTGVMLRTWQVDLITYGVMLALWLVAWTHLLWW